MRYWPLFVGAWLLPATALALGPGEASLSGGLGLTLARPDETRAGAQAEVRLLRGVTDSWAARLGLQATWIPESGATSSTYVAMQALGLTWAADALNLVPFVDLGIVVADVRGGGRLENERLGAQAGIGADYCLARHWVLSLLGRIDYLALRFAGGHEPSLVLSTFALHLGRMF